MIEENTVGQAVVAADRVARELLRLAGEDDMVSLTALACNAYQDEPHLLPMVLSMWFGWAVEACGAEAVNDLVEKVSLNIADAPVEHARSRALFCELLFGLQDSSSRRVLGAWEGLMEHGGWEVAAEVLSLFLGFTAYFTGWSDSE